MSLPCGLCGSRLILLCLFFVVFVSSKSYIYITPTTTAPSNVIAPQISNECTSIINEPIYENIENGNIVPSEDNKFTIYVNYDEIINGKCKSSVRLLEPDVKLIQRNTKDLHESNINDDVVVIRGDNDDDDDDMKNGNSSKMIQCQQISMYIGEKLSKIYLIEMANFMIKFV